jgi:hypothetical protein
MKVSIEHSRLFYLSKWIFLINLLFDIHVSKLPRCYGIRVSEFGCNILSNKELIQAIIIEFVLQKIVFP